MPVEKTSHLYGTLEPSGFKGFPGKVFGMRDLNPPQPIPEVAQATIRRTTNTGQLFNFYNKPLARNTIDPFFQSAPGTRVINTTGPTTGSYGSSTKASNSEMLVSFGKLPTYPEEERIMGQLARSQRTPEERAELRERLRDIKVKALPKPSTLAGMKIREKYDSQKIRQLEELGFPSDVIEDAINEEVKRDIGRALANPGLLAEQQVQNAIGAAYAVVQERRAARLNNGQGAGAQDGDAGGLRRPPGVQPFNSGSLGADMERAKQYPAVSMLKASQRRMASLRAENAGGEADDSEEGLAGRFLAGLGRANVAAEARGVAAAAMGGALGGGGGLGGF